MSLRREVQRIVHSYGIVPKKRLGQNFLVDEATLHKMVSYASLSSKDTVLEIGAGLGFLTEEIAKNAKAVIAVEIDAKLVKILKDRLRGYKNVVIIKGDIMKLKLPPFDKVVSTPPYSISSPIHFWLLEKNPKDAVLAFQEEFAKRLAASIGSEDYGRLTVTTYYRAEAEVLDRIPKEKFWPPPKVDSVIVRLRPREPPFFVENEEIFFEFVKVIFAQRNKKLRNAAIPFFGRFKFSKALARELADALPFHNRRPRELSPEEIGLTVNEIIGRLRKLKVI